MTDGLLAGKVVLVSGAGPGLGAQVALAAGAAGARVVIGARNPERLAEVEAAIVAAGGTVVACPCDVTVEADCRRIVALGRERFGGIDCVVNNAYAPGPMTSPIADADFDEWREVFEVNVFGSLGMAQAAIPVLRERGGGSIVFIGSQIVRRVFAGRGPYASSKAALVTAAQVLAREVGREGIRVNTVVPGRMWGPNFQRAHERWAAERGVTLEEELRPVRELLALPSIPTDVEVAGSVVFLASDLSLGITGQTLDVNGGETFT